MTEKKLKFIFQKKNIKRYSHQKKKKTGYERVPEDNEFYYGATIGVSESGFDSYDEIDDGYYESANYYSSEIVAENNARADKLMRRLRRFAVEHRECGVDFNSTETEKHYIYYDCIHDELKTVFTFYAKTFGTILFDSEETAQAAIDEFHDELIWYFTEYKEGL